jgi:hypothetical protein
MANSDQILKRGQMNPFVATRTFDLGSTGEKLYAGQLIHFDGSMVRVNDANYSMPTLRGAIREGWIIPEEDYDPEHSYHARPQPANIVVRSSAKGGNPMDPSANKPTKQMLQVVEPNEREVHRGFKTASQGDLQEGVPVRTLSTPAGERAKRMRTTLTSENAGAAIRAAETNVQINPGKGITLEEQLARMSPREREDYLERRSESRSSYDEVAPRRATPTPKTASKKSEPKSRAKGQPIIVEDNSDLIDLGGFVSNKSQEHETEVIEREGIKFTQTALKSRKAKSNVVVKDSKLDVRRLVAKQLCSDFPDNYQFDLEERKKVARLRADYEDRHDVIRAVYAAECDAMKDHLLNEFPDAFSG